MPVTNTFELAQTFEREVGRPATVKRRIICVLADNTLEGNPPTEIEVMAAALVIPQQTVLNSTLFGLAHPRLAAWKLRKFWINEGYEGSPYHVEVVLEYNIVRDEELLSPTNRPAVWNVEGGQGEVPALGYYDQAGNASTKPLTNSAYDFYPGLTVEEATARITVKKNFASFPTSWMAAMNYVNDDLYFGMPIHTAKIAPVVTSYAYEEWGGSVVKYWDTTATIVYRQSGHNLLLPDVGFNFIDGGQKRRAMVFDFNNSEWVPSANPIGLNGSGGQSPTGHPAILTRRVNPETSFATLFGTPPT